MLNQAVLVGRIVKDPELKDTEKGKVTNITLAVPRTFKNSNGEYDTDFISCVLWKGVAESTVEYCKKGDLVGIKGRIQTRDVELEDKEDLIFKAIEDIKKNGLRKEELSRLFDKIVIYEPKEMERTGILT